MVKVTIIIPIYNAEDTLSHCLDSIIKQTYNDYNVLLINDGSTDNSLTIIKEYKKNHPERFKVINKENEGVVATRHLGIRESTGVYIMFVDNDDFLDEDYVKTFIEEAERGDYDVVLGGYRRANLETVRYTVTAYEKEWTKYQITAPWARIFKREFIVENNIHFLEDSIGEDLYFNMQSYSKSDKIKIINYTGYNWFYNVESVSNTKQKGLQEECDVVVLLDAIYELFKETKDPLLHYFFNRYVVWYLLFSGKEARSNRFVEEHKRLYGWLKKKNIHNSLSMFNQQISGEPFSNRMAVTVLNVITRLRMINIFSKLYCKGK